jgi:hypothetical protein
MEILLNKYYLGSEIVRAFSLIPKYATEVITKTERFEEGLGILPKEVKIELTSLTKAKKTIKECRLFIVIDNINLSNEYDKIDMVIKYLYNDGSLSYAPLFVSNEGKDFKNEIETIILQVIRVLNNELIPYLQSKP